MFGRKGPRFSAIERIRTGNGAQLVRGDWTVDRLRNICFGRQQNAEASVLACRGVVVMVAVAAVAQGLSRSWPPFRR